MSLPPDASTEAARAAGAPGEPRIGRRAVRGFLAMALGNAARAALKVVLLAVLGRLLLPAEFGVVEAAGIVVWFSMIFASLGVGPALVQREALEQRHVASAVTVSVALGGGVAALVYLSAPVLETLLRVPGLAPVLRGLAVAFPIAGLSSVAECLLQRHLRFGVIARGELISYAAGYGAVGVSLAATGFGPWALVAAEIVKSVVKSVLFLAAVPDARRAGFDPAAVKELMRFGSGYTASALTAYAASQGDYAVVARRLGASALGYYGRAMELMIAPAAALGMVLDKVLFPTLALVQDRPDLLRAAYRRCTALVALLVLPVSLTTAVLAPEVIAVLLGPRWGAAATPLRVLSIAMYFRVGYMVGHAVANSTGAVHQAAWRNAVYAALIVVGALVGSLGGLAGVAAGVLVAVIANYIMVFRLAGRIAAVRGIEFLTVHVPAARFALIAGGVAWLTAVAGRMLNAPASLILVLAGLLTGVVLLALVRSVPGMLGPEGEWIAQTLHDRTPRALQPLVRRFIPELP